MSLFHGIGANFLKTLKKILSQNTMIKDKKDQTFIIANQSPYFLHPSDCPSAVIIAIKFDGKNYDL